MQEYVCGFAFNNERSRVVLIKKERPEWQRGKWNGVGGKIESIDNSAYAAMAREFVEETGLATDEGAWRRFLVLRGTDWIVHFFRAFDVPIDLCRTVTDEVVATMWVFTLPLNSVPNLHWLIPLAVQDAYFPDDGHNRPNMPFQVRQVSPKLGRGGE